VQDQQADAVISLNDPSVASPQIILIPIIAGDASTPSAKFFNKLMNSIGTVAVADPITGQFQSTDIQTGSKWGFSQLFDTNKIENSKEVSVKNGFFAWEAMPSLERYVKEVTLQRILYSWRAKSDAPKPLYVMLEKPLPVSSSDLRSLISTLPVTPWEEAIHPIGLWTVYKQGPPSNCGVPMRESMTDFSKDISELSDQVDSCDPFLSNALSRKSTYSSDKLLSTLFNVALFIAGFIGAYIALAAVARFYDVEYSEFTKSIGKVVAIGLKKMFGASAAAGSALKNLRANPTGVATQAAAPAPAA
jgi:hypothetical protein